MKRNKYSTFICLVYRDFKSGSCRIIERFLHSGYATENSLSQAFCSYPSYIVEEGVKFVRISLRLFVLIGDKKRIL